MYIQIIVDGFKDIAGKSNIYIESNKFLKFFRYSLQYRKY